MGLHYVRLGKGGSSTGMFRDPSSYTGIAAAPVILWAASVLIAATYSAPFRMLASEDGPIETAQAAVLVGCALLSACIALALHRRNRSGWSVLYACLAAACLWTAGEEISWGQRLFGLATPEWLAHNRQGEANLHNLPGVGSTLYRVVWCSLWVAVVLSLVTSYWKPSLTARWRTDLWVPPPILIPFWLCFLSYDAVRALDQWWFQRDHVALTVSRLQEPAEFLLYGGVLAFLAIVLVRVRAGPARGRMRGSSELQARAAGADHR
ncbi:MAG TPA: hypothetical protein VFZ01_18865 [Geminicoccaceae bacterium]